MKYIRVFGSKHGFLRYSCGYVHSHVNEHMKRHDVKDKRQHTCHVPTSCCRTGLWITAILGLLPKKSIAESPLRMIDGTKLILISGFVVVVELGWFCITIWMSSLGIVSVNVQRSHMLAYNLERICFQEYNFWNASGQISNNDYIEFKDWLWYIFSVSVLIFWICCRNDLCTCFLCRVHKCA